MSKTIWPLVILVLVGTLIAAATTPAAAGAYPDVSGLQPWTPESNYMSLAGYLRWMTFREQGVWLSMAEAKRIVVEQLQAE